MTESIDNFSHITNFDKLILTIKTKLISFLRNELKNRDINPIESSVLSCVKKITIRNGQDVWAFFCSIINFTVEVRKFMIPMLNSIAAKIEINFGGNFLKFVKSSIFKKKLLLSTFKWHWKDIKGNYKKQVGWSHHRILKVWHLIYILQILKVIITKNESFQAFAQNIHRNYNNFEEFIQKFITSFHGDPRIFGKGEITSQKCFKRYLLFFRWVVAPSPDLHIWTFISQNDLLPPVDVTIKRTLKRIGVFNREYGCNWKDVQIYNSFLSKITPENKLWADFWISRLGILKICNSKKSESLCDICPLSKFCVY